MKKYWVWILSILSLLILFFIGYKLLSKEFTTQNPSQELLNICKDNPLVVKEVIDGDTFELCSGERVRLLCIDSPEKNKEGYEEAKYFLEELILYKEVELKESNYNGPDKDKYNRILRWVYIKGDNTSINRYIFENNHGIILQIPPETCIEISN